MSSINEDIVRKVASLARLKLSDAEVRALVPQLQSIFTSFENLAEVDTQGVEPLVTPTPMAFRARSDEVHSENGGADRGLQQAPERSGNLFKVPPVV